MYPIKTVYLSGPITGLTYKNAKAGWRTHFASLLPAHIQPYSPMRAKEFLASQRGKLGGDPETYEDMPQIASASGIMMRDTNDVRSSDAIVVGFLGAKQISIGSVHELGMAHILQKPVILVMEKDGSNPMHHIFVTESAGYWFDNYEEAAIALTALLTPGV